MKRALKRDSNEREIINALVKAGAFVLQEHNIDLYVLYRGVWTPLEVKSKGGSLTPYQENLHEVIDSDHGYSIPIVYSVDDAFKAVGIDHE